VDSCFYNSAPSFPASHPNRSSSVRFTIRNATPGDLNDLADVLASSFHSQRGIDRWLFPLLRLGIYEDLRYRLLLSPPLRYICLVACGSFEASDDDFASTSENRYSLAGTVELGLRTFPIHSYQVYRGELSGSPSHYAYISNLAVRDRSRRQGVAQQLLQACERTAIEWGFSDLYLHVVEDNDRARQLYSKLGYRIAATEETWGSWLFGKPRQLFLHKNLAESRSS
jgi:ribosomal protein S18 acetylase RimI-like enzyme